MRHVTDFLKAFAQKAIKLNFLAILIFDKKAFRWKMYEVNHFGSAQWLNAVKNKGSGGANDWLMIKIMQ